MTFLQNPAAAFLCTCEILVSGLDALLVALLVGVEVSHVDADEGTGRDVAKGPDAPAPLLSLEHLKLQPGKKGSNKESLKQSRKLGNNSLAWHFEAGKYDSSILRNV